MVEFFPPNSKPYGLSYEEHIMKYWKRILSIPTNENPATDTTGERCTFRQDPHNSSVFYLSGSTEPTVVRSCKIPAGSSLFISVNDVEASEAEKPGASIEDLHNIARNDEDHATTATLIINDQVFDMKDLKDYRFHTKDFDATFPDNGLFGVNSGQSSKVVADGYYVITNPLPSGKYTIQTKAAVTYSPNTQGQENNWASDVTYHLVVE
jgi:hypothetical protein